MDILQAQGEMMIDRLLNFFFGLVDGTNDNDEDADEKLKRLRRK